METASKKDYSLLGISVFFISCMICAVKSELFCPPAVYGEDYRIVAERDGASLDLINETVIWHHQNYSVSCFIVAYQLNCRSDQTVLDNIASVAEAVRLGDGGIQLTLIIASFNSLYEGEYSIEWKTRTNTTIDRCQVYISAIIDECMAQQPPCVQAERCVDQEVGYTCVCKPGYSGKNCNRGDNSIHCNYNIYNIRFPKPVDSCGTINISCYLASGSSQQDFGLTAQESGSNSSSFLETKPDIQGGVVFFKICIRSSTPTGVYQTNYSLTSSQSKTSFLFTINTLVNENNTAPVFNTPNGLYLINVLETLSVGSILATVNKSKTATCVYDAQSQCIQVIDPDSSSSNGVDSLRPTVSLASPPPSSITFQNTSTSSSLGFFFVSNKLTPSTTVSFNLMVIDGAGAKASAMVTFQVMGMNKAPTCDTKPFYMWLDIRTVPGTVVWTVPCNDSDTQELYRRMSYSIKGPYSKYFTVPEGKLTLNTSLLNLGVLALSFNLTVTGYSASPDSSYVFNIPVYIKITVPEPICNLTVVSLPANWSIGADVNLRLQCDNGSVDKLNISDYNQKDTFNMSYIQESSTVYRIRLSVRQYVPGVYNFTISATLGGNDSLSNVLLRMYNPPRFISSSHSIRIADTAAVGAQIVTLVAITDLPNSTLLFSFRGDFNENLFTLSKSGVIMLNQPAHPFSGQQFHLTIEVQDSVSQLTDQATVDITVMDINEAPECSQPGPVQVDSTLPANSVLTTIICTDPDVTPIFKNLTYNISAEPPTVLLSIRSNGEIVLLQEFQKGVTFVRVTVVVSDINMTIILYFNITINWVVCSAVSERGLYFPDTPVNSVVRILCPQSYTGEIYRNCYSNKTWAPFNLNNCRRKDLANVTNLINQLKQNGSSLTDEEMTRALKSVAESLARSLDMNGNVQSGDINQMVNILYDVGHFVTQRGQVTVDTPTLQNVASASDTIVGADTQTWAEVQEEGEQGAQLLQALDSITVASLRQGVGDDLPLVMENLAIKRGSIQDDVVFPNTEESGYQNESSWVLASNISAILSKDAFVSAEGDVKYSVILYRNITDKLKINQSLQSGLLADKVLNSDILSVSVSSKLGSLLSSPLILSFPIKESNYSDPVCGFLDTSASTLGTWSSKGCVTEVVGDQVRCSCNHLTNFAVLTSQYRNLSAKDEMILSIISAIGCGISIVCLVITIIVHVMLWRYVRCDRSVLHVNLSVCLILAYVVFLAGVDRTDNKVGCAVVAALLHFLFLAVFFLMLSEGIEVFKSVSFVFSGDSILCHLLTLAYGVPLIIVAISLGVTKTEGYGSDKTCWLSIEDGVIWAFVGPALAVILINFIIVVQVLRIMQNSKTMLMKSAQIRIKSVVRTIWVLSPILGITWVFGVLSVNQETLVFQYLFAICNSLQGFFIFLCYCLLTPQVREGFRSVRRKHQAKSFISSQKMGTSSTYTGSHSYSDTNGTRHQKNSHNSRDPVSTTSTRSTTVRSRQSDNYQTSLDEVYQSDADQHSFNQRFFQSDPDQHNVNQRFELGSGLSSTPTHSARGDNFSFSPEGGSKKSNGSVHSNQALSEVNPGFYDNLNSKLSYNKNFS